MTNKLTIAGRSEIKPSFGLSGQSIQKRDLLLSLIDVYLSAKSDSFLNIRVDNDHRIL